MSDPKHADLWRELVDEAGEDEIERATRVSVAQAEAELTAAGFDVAAERAKADAFLEALAAGGGASRSEEATRRPAEPTRGRRPRSAVLWLAAAATFAAGGVLYATLHASPEPVAKGHSPAPSAPAPIAPSADDLAVAADLRRKAAAACDAKQWSVCLAVLDQARAVDPDGDTTVTRLREKAIAGILEPLDAPPPRK